MPRIRPHRRTRRDFFDDLPLEEQEKQRAKKTRKHKDRKGGFFSGAAGAIAKLVNAADDLFPDDGKGPERREWVIDQAVKLIKTPAGDPIERIIISFLIGLTIDEEDEDELVSMGYSIREKRLELQEGRDST